jgi:hypothetical protein
MEYRSLLFFFWGSDVFQVVFGVENGLSLVHFSQVSTQAKISSFKNPHIKIDLLLPRGPISTKLLYSIMNLNTISLPW